MNTVKYYWKNLKTSIRRSPWAYVAYASALSAGTAYVGENNHAATWAFITSLWTAIAIIERDRTLK